MRRGLAVLALGLMSLAGCATRPRLWVFTAPWDARSDAALAAGVAPQAAIVTGWIALDPAGGPPAALYPDPPRPPAERTGPRFALVTSYRDDRFHPEAVRTLHAAPAARARAADTLEHLVRAGAYAGIVLDLEALEPADTAALEAVVNALSAAARRGGATEVAIAVPALDTLAYPPRRLLRHVDRLLVMLYDQHWAGGAPGPVAAHAWARDALAQWVGTAGPDRVVAALPLYGYHWRPGTPADVIGWPDVQRLSRESGVGIERDTASGAPRLRLGAQGEAWATDGPLLARLAADARTLGVRTVALWRLGLEDPTVWTTLGAR